MQHFSSRRMSTCARLTTRSFAPSRSRNPVCTVLAGKSGLSTAMHGFACPSPCRKTTTQPHACTGRQEKEAKKQRRKAFLQKRREEAAWRSETQRPDHWFELRQDGLWQEHRSAPPGKAAGRAQRAAASRTSSGYNPTAQGERQRRGRACYPPSTDAGCASAQELWGTHGWHRVG